VIRELQEQPVLKEITVIREATGERVLKRYLVTRELQEPLVLKEITGDYPELQEPPVLKEIQVIPELQEPPVAKGDLLVTRELQEATWC